MKPNRLMASNKSQGRQEDRNESNEADGPLPSQKQPPTNPVSLTKVYKEQTPSSIKTTLSITIERNGKSPQSDQTGQQATNVTDSNGNKRDHRKGSRKDNNGKHRKDRNGKKSKEAPASNESNSQDLSNQSSQSASSRSGSQHSESIKSKTNESKKPSSRRSKSEETNKETNKSTKHLAAGPESASGSSCFKRRTLGIVLIGIAALLTIFLLIFFEGESLAHSL